tara:strand:- start:4663 stop:4938 length:276 start_codon:yes stop_codon:yes gene_type:complete
MFLTLSSASESLWAEHGLTGLVLSALFGLILVFVRSISSKDEAHREFLRELLAEERGERKETRKELAENNDKLSAAIGGLAEEIRRGRRDD